MVLSLVAIPHILAIQALYLPNLDSFLQKLNLHTNLADFLYPEIFRGVEMFLGLILPITVYCSLPAYSKFRRAPDDSDVKNEIHRSVRKKYQKFIINNTSITL